MKAVFQRALSLRSTTTVAAARRLLANVDLIHVDDALLNDAAEIGGTSLRMLDAVHLAAVRSIGRDLAAVITYDERMDHAAGEIGLTVVAPA